MIYYVCGICQARSYIIDSQPTLYKKGEDYVCKDHRDQEPKKGAVE